MGEPGGDEGEGAVRGAVDHEGDDDGGGEVGGGGGVLEGDGGGGVGVGVDMVGGWKGGWGWEGGGNVCGKGSVRKGVGEEEGKNVGLGCRRELFYIWRVLAV